MADQTQVSEISAGDVQRRMDEMYRLQRHIYDASRLYYLLGRDRLITDLNLASGERVCEIGCGTGRNLVKMARRYPHADLLGLDASTEMLKSADAKVARAGVDGHVRLALGFAERFDPAATFGATSPLDRVVFSYALSMIPAWRLAIDRALAAVKPGGRVHIVDFGDQARLPGWFRDALFAWLDRFDVHVHPEMIDHLRGLEREGRATVEITPLFRDYAVMATLTAR